MKIAIVGTGYVGLVSGTGFAEMGNQVVCVDLDEKKVNNLKEGILPIYEPGLDDLVIRNAAAKRLSFTTSLVDALSQSEIIFICVGTPEDKDGSADLRYVLQVAQDIGKNVNDYKVVVTKSTVPVGTNAKVQAVLDTEMKKQGKAFEVDVVSNPEFLKEGAAVEDFMRPDRIVVGVASNRAQKIMEKLYAPFVRNGHPVLFMDIPSAEMTKYAANAMLATKISFMNEVAQLCEKVGADVSQVRKGIGSDSRIGYSFIYAGLGYGGSCFPKDVRALIATGEHQQSPMQILKAVDDVNLESRERFIQTILKFYQETPEGIKGRTFAMWGLAFKPGTDDMRMAPSVTIARALTQLGARVQAYDPVATHEAEKAFVADGVDMSKVQFGADPFAVLEGADAMILVTEWREFREPDFARIKGLLKSAVIFDGRNQYDLETMQENGFKYFAVGRPRV